MYNSFLILSVQLTSPIGTLKTFQEDIWNPILAQPSKYTVSDSKTQLEAEQTHRCCLLGLPVPVNKVLTHISLLHLMLVTGKSKTSLCLYITLQFEATFSVQKMCLLLLCRWIKLTIIIDSLNRLYWVCMHVFLSLFNKLQPSQFFFT